MYLLMICVSLVNLAIFFELHFESYIYVYFFQNTLYFVRKNGGHPDDNLMKLKNSTNYTHLKCNLCAHFTHFN